MKNILYFYALLLTTTISSMETPAKNAFVEQAHEINKKGYIGSVKKTDEGIVMIVRNDSSITIDCYDSELNPIKQIKNNAYPALATSNKYYAYTTSDSIVVENLKTKERYELKADSRHIKIFEDQIFYVEYKGKNYTLKVWNFKTNENRTLLSDRANLRKIKILSPMHFIVVEKKEQDYQIALYHIQQPLQIESFAVEKNTGIIIKKISTERFHIALGKSIHEINLNDGAILNITQIAIKNDIQKLLITSSGSYLTTDKRSLGMALWDSKGILLKDIEDRCQYISLKKTALPNVIAASTMDGSTKIYNLDTGDCIYASKKKRFRPQLAILGTNVIAIYNNETPDNAHLCLYKINKDLPS